jgi:hypothetical protein
VTANLVHIVNARITGGIFPADFSGAITRVIVADEEDEVGKSLGK